MQPTTEGPAAVPGRRPHRPPPPIPFNRPFTTGREFDYIRAAIDNLHLSGNGPFGARCADWLAERCDSERVLLTPSGTAALELACATLALKPGDEVIMPSFTFVSTANAVAARGAVPVFVDVRSDTLNLDERLLEEAVSERTRAVLPVHYGGVGAAMEAIGAFAARHGLAVIEDAAQGLLATAGSQPLGGGGTIGCLSFHETKNVSCGEGGAVLVNDPKLVDRAEVLQEKGTDRQRFFRGEVDRYRWVDLGSSYLLSEINAAFLWAQLERADEITARRMAVWMRYHESFAELESRGAARRPVVPAGCAHNAHLYYLLLPDRATRDSLIEALARRGIQAVFHYVPLHSSPAGRRLGRACGELSVTDSTAERIVRLPLWAAMDESAVERVTRGVLETLP